MNTTKHIYLVRHAQYDNPRQILVGRLPVPLSTAGVAEAKKLAAYFADKHITAIYSSPVARCLETAQTIAQDHLTVTPDLRLAETFSPYQGYWELDWQHFYNHHDDLGGESPQDLLDRVMDFWQELQQSPHQNIIICSHGDPLYLLYVGLTHGEIPDLTTIYQIPESVYQPKASVRPVTVTDGNVSVSDMITVDQLK